MATTNPPDEPGLSSNGPPVPRPGPWKFLKAGLFLFALPSVVLLGKALNIELCVTRYFNFSCPGCGLGRASLALFSGDLATSWAMHPLAPMALVLLSWFALWVALEILGLPVARRIDPQRLVPSRVWMIIGLLFLLFWLARFGPWLGLPPLPI
ncbi:MAG: DUF2752 domain-containing protein [Myxococcota bacterium]|nr:DUF2752 domain-containing protein [Myxococcota bacterium]